MFDEVKLFCYWEGWEQWCIYYVHICKSSKFRFG